MSFTIDSQFFEQSSSLNFKLGDKRIDKRANLILNKMSTSAEKTLPQIFSNEADLKGVYRFFENNLITPQKVLEPHTVETIARCQKQVLVAVVQDSSDLDYDYLNNLVGFNPLHTNVEKGFRIHPLLAITENGTPLGVVNTFNYTRSTQSSKHRNSLTIEQKESNRWLLGYLEACKLSEQTPGVQIVSISDREGDIYECLAEARNNGGDHKADILVRSNHNRSLVKSTDETNNKLEKKLIRCSVRYEAKLRINQYREDDRIANIVVRATPVMIQAPQTCKKKSLPPVEMNAVLVSEVDPPEGAKAIYWLLLTTLPIDTVEDIFKIVSLYSKRWTIEIYFKALKTGCKIDSIRFDATSKIENFIAMAMIVAWKVMLATYLPREYPKLTCTVLFTEMEWKLAYSRAYNNQRPLPEKPPTLQQAVMLVAMLGGYQKRKTPPGMQTIWRGMSRLIDMIYGYEISQMINQRIKLDKNK